MGIDLEVQSEELFVSRNIGGGLMIDTASYQLGISECLIIGEPLSRVDIKSSAVDFQ